jgi:hypothetical protein
MRLQRSQRLQVYTTPRVDALEKALREAIKGLHTAENSLGWLGYSQSPMYDEVVLFAEAAEKVLEDKHE